MVNSVPLHSDSSDNQMDPYRHYLEVRTSLFHFGQLPGALEKEEDRRKLLQEVVKQESINHTVQTTPEYAMMVLSDQEIDEALSEIYQQLKGQDDVEAQLEQLGFTDEQLREAVIHDLRVAAVLNYVAEQEAPVTDMDAELFYRMHIDQFTKPEKRTARHILVTINDDYKENSRSEAKKRINDIHTKLKGQPEQFEKLAKAHSECPTALEGGVLGHLNKGQLYPELDAVLFSLKEGEIAPVTESELGFHIMMCEIIEPSAEIPFEQVREKIKSALRKRNQRSAQRRWLKDRMAKVHAN